MNNTPTISVTKLKKGEIIPLKEDFLFKKVFGSNENIERLEELLSIYFNVPRKELKGKVKVLNDNLRKENKKSKDQKLDIIADVQIGIGTKKIDIEMNVDEGSTIYRNVLYASRLLGNQLKVKQSYKDAKPVIQINFDCYEINEDNERIIKRCFIKDETNTVISNALEIDHINIEKCSVAWYNKTIKNYEKNEQDLIRLGALFTMKNLKDFKSCLKEVHMSKEVKEDIEEATIEYSEDEYLLDLFDKEKIIEDDKILAKEKGIKEGIEQGKNSEKIEIAKNAIKQGLNIETISKITGLSIEEIQNLK